MILGPEHYDCWPYPSFTRVEALKELLGPFEATLINRLSSQYMCEFCGERWPSVRSSVAAGRKRRCNLGNRVMARKSHYDIPKPTWTCPHCGFVHTAADLMRLDSDQFCCKSCGKPLQTYPL